MRLAAYLTYITDKPHLNVILNFILPSRPVKGGECNVSYLVPLLPLFQLSPTSSLTGDISSNSSHIFCDPT